jgi:hypothetical protein
MGTFRDSFGAFAWAEVVGGSSWLGNLGVRLVRVCMMNVACCE